MISKVLAVFALGLVELWAAVPAGLALGLHPLATAGATILGAMAGVLAVVLVGERLRSWLLGRRGSSGSGGRLATARRLWDRYGVVGLGLLGPLLLGAPLGAALGITLGATTRRLLLWMAVGIALWTTLLTLAATLGLAGLDRLRGS